MYEHKPCIKIKKSTVEYNLDWVIGVQYSSQKKYIKFEPRASFYQSVINNMTCDTIKSNNRCSLPITYNIKTVGR